MDARDRHNGQRDERTNERTDVRPSVRSFVRLLDAVWHMYTDCDTNRLHIQGGPKK